MRLSYYRRDPGGDLKVVQSEPLKVTTILPMQGLGADPTLTPTYKGLTDADSVANWDPPEGVDIDKSKVTKADEDYWHTVPRRAEAVRQPEHRPPAVGRRVRRRDKRADPRRPRRRVCESRCATRSTPPRWG